MIGEEQNCTKEDPLCGSKKAPRRNTEYARGIDSILLITLPVFLIKVEDDPSTM